MFKPKKLLLLSLSLSLSFLLLSLPAFVFAEESITITTYYPSPYGVYNELQLFPHNPAVTICDDAHKGTMFYKSTDDQVYVCKGTTLSWKPVSGAGVKVYTITSGYTSGVGAQDFCISQGYSKALLYRDWWGGCCSSNIGTCVVLSPSWDKTVLLDTVDNPTLYAGCLAGIYCCGGSLRTGGQYQFQIMCSN